jgi:hypothetical protein
MVACMLEDRSMSDTDMSFRAAEESRRLAANVANAVEKQELHRVADQWIRLARWPGWRLRL